jgi:hypothetical protein
MSTTNGRALEAVRKFRERGSLTCPIQPYATSDRVSDHLACPLRLGLLVRSQLCPPMRPAEVPGGALHRLARPSGAIRGAEMMLGAAVGELRLLPAGVCLDAPHGPNGLDLSPG